jgi:hypothetical protein
VNTDPKNSRTRSGLKANPQQLSPNTNTRTARQLPELDPIRRSENRLLATEQLLRLLHDKAPNLWEIARVVGKWVWIEFREKPAQEITNTLSQFGFSWNKKRHSWQHPCGDTRSIAANYDPRRRYGSRPVTQLQTTNGGQEDE